MKIDCVAERDCRRINEVEKERRREEKE